MTVSAGVVAFRIGSNTIDIEPDTVNTDDGLPTYEDLLGASGKVGKTKKPNAAYIEVTAYLNDDQKRSDILVSGQPIQVEYSNGVTETLSGSVDYVGERKVDRSKNTISAKWSGKTLKEVGA